MIDAIFGTGIILAHIVLGLILTLGGIAVVYLIVYFGTSGYNRLEEWSKIVPTVLLLLLSFALSGQTPKDFRYELDAQYSRSVGVPDALYYAHAIQVNHYEIEGNKRAVLTFLDAEDTGIIAMPFDIRGPERRPDGTTQTSYVWHLAEYYVEVFSSTVKGARSEIILVYRPGEPFIIYVTKTH